MQQIIRAAFCTALAVAAAPLPSAAAPDRASDQYAAQYLYWSIDSAMAAAKFDDLACRKAAEPQIRGSACGKMAQDKKELDRLHAVAKAAKVKPPSDISDSEKSVIHKLSMLSGQDFDVHYTGETSNALSQDIRRTETAAAQVSDPHVLAFIAERLPTLERAYDQARQTEAVLPGMAPHRWGITASNDHQPTEGPLPRFHGY